ncbi:hypothetical protein B0T11DRAFT_134095 [Plectosphaerella cucumerina]|uniref:Uncharacterized protein n=1 Tax=Plectosphaerella cucumerina TaxID=40658 RepID=A0A8K0WZZ5_9PEZI|nr:hypothetical protein B0T11DRAFT_134095 [Plectosphaerella cucumerina]
MSAHLKNEAATETGFLGTFRRQVLNSVPSVPSIIDLKGQTAIVTGANGGLGLESGRQFLQLGLNHLIISARSQGKGDAAADTLRKEFPSAKIDIWLLDMESASSVRDFARRCESLDRLDIVVLNAACGKMSFERVGGGKGREATLQVNYLSTMLLTILLVPILKAKRHDSNPGRLTVVGSDAAYMVELPQTSGSASILDAHEDEASYEGFPQYCRSKLLLIMGVTKLAETIDREEVIINYVNPGATKGTALNREATGISKVVLFIVSRILGRDVVDAARQYVYSAVVLGKESHGSFTDYKIRPYPTLMYTDDGRQKMDGLWKETLAELGVSL